MEGMGRCHRTGQVAGHAQIPALPVGLDVPGKDFCVLVVPVNPPIKAPAGNPFTPVVGDGEMSRDAYFHAVTPLVGRVTG